MRCVLWAQDQPVWQVPSSCTNNLKCTTKPILMIPDFQPIEPRIIVIEKGSKWAHTVCLVLCWIQKPYRSSFRTGKKRPDFPVERWVEKEQMLVLTENAGRSLPAMPPELHDMGKPIISIAKFQKWLAENCESRGIEVLDCNCGVVTALQRGQNTGCGCSLSGSRH